MEILLLQVFLLYEKGLIERGDKLLLTGFGGGMTWGTMLISW